MSVRILGVRGLALVQDAGRPGLADLGVGPSGSFDRRAARHGNLLVGNGLDAAVLELVGSLTMRTTRPTTMAVTGAPGDLWADDTPFPAGRAVRLGADTQVTVGAASPGVRRVLAFAGGITVDLVLGSRSYDTLAQIGPRPLSAGDLLPIAPTDAHASLDDIEPAIPGAGDLEVRVVLGPRDDWFTAGAIETLVRTGWTVSPRSDRIGVRLEGPVLQRAIDGELESEPVVRGSIQVTSAGLPVVLGPDHPVTGGYPVIGVVLDADTDLLAQAAPGRVVRFRRHMT